MIRATIPDAKRLWDIYQLPASLELDTFLDVGCWAGGFLVEAVKRKARLAVGVDVVRSPGLDLSLRESEQIKFILMDIFSPHWFSLPRFDWVLCAGVIYHVLNPVGLLHRLKAVLRDDGRLFLETVVVEGEHPLLSFCPGKSFDDNASNWFVPSPTALFPIAEEVGLCHYNSFMVSENRAMFEFGLNDRLPEKFMSRKTEYMND